MRYSHILVSKEESFSIVQLNRPEVLNALNIRLMTEFVDALEELDSDDTVRVIIVTGNEKAFAAGADIED
jgi:enoyl-CoA hydratase